LTSAYGSQVVSFSRFKIARVYPASNRATSATGQKPYETQGKPGSIPRNLAPPKGFIQLIATATAGGVQKRERKEVTVVGLNLFGYLDPGSGSMLLQVLVGGIAGLGVVLRFYGRTLLQWLGGS
jgi:hypothetical protein